ncbi:protein kinase [Streptomyces sp. NPDC007088]|uniref:Stk1 family PASTA domain-containing Ser/Thr kinase n=1 Tax=Streptomyces sp. NPDC007088 TaxID=3364773 RepID=UPI0036C60EE3
MSQDGGAHGRYAGHSVAKGRYQLRDLLGEGGMASVHLAYDSVLDRQVAIKTLHTELGREPAFRERFRREAQAVAKLTHTNIVSVFDTGEDDLDGTTTPYIVMEFVEGLPLGSVFEQDVARFGAMPTDKALKITGDVLAALEISHEMGLVHRDIKPGNVMLTKRGVVKVMDFGIARAIQSGVTSMTQTGMVVGTPQYLSPEQALGRGVDARSDIYSVGIMLFQLLTGRLPFDADSPLAIAYAHVQEEPVAPSSLNQSLPPAVDALVARALRKNPNERFPTAESMREECDRVARSLSGAAPSVVRSAPSQSGTGVGAAVFPPVDQSAQPPQGPYAAQSPYQLPHPAPHSAYGTPHPAPQTAQPPVQAGYGYPQQGYATPPPYQQPATPYGSRHPAGRTGGGKRGRGLVVASAVVAVLAVVAAIAVLAQRGKDTGDDRPRAKESASHQAGYRGPDKTKTIDPKKCTDPTESYNDPDKIEVPNFQYKYVNSVKDCLRAAGWEFTVKFVPDNTFGEGSVIDQWPAARTNVDEKDRGKMTLSVSTGNPE